MKKTLLVVDDEPTIQRILKRYFEDEYLVVPQPNGQAAMQWLDDGNDVDAIVADYEMPVMNGPAFIKRLRTSILHRHVPLIMLSGKEESSSKIQCLRHGADDYMVKPFNPEELALRLKNMMRKLSF
ncbi:response regulator transcription factor [Hymenobacter siberiensis]|uniref:response regulator transcription factor n=1 Tax=Hymenobacter siberiensis TaxID=2848396 RepID=UPI001C1DD3A7|nr:response regulator transcription factor [Hymenobacter siberiensis]MBU6121960.1 response regulator transcription factor [Hymenobacter siberiensis]